MIGKWYGRLQNLHLFVYVTTYILTLVGRASMLFDKLMPKVLENLKNSIVDKVEIKSKNDENQEKFSRTKEKENKNTKKSFLFIYSFISFQTSFFFLGLFLIFFGFVLLREGPKKIKLLVSLCGITSFWVFWTYYKDIFLPSHNSGEFFYYLPIFIAGICVLISFCKKQKFNNTLEVIHTLYIYIFLLFSFLQNGLVFLLWEVSLRIENNFHNTFFFSSNPFMLNFWIDGLSLCFLLLTGFIFPICIFAATSIVKEPLRFIVYLIILQYLLVYSFAANDLLVFYIAFEAILIPMFLIIGFWGSREQKIKAAYYLFLYTLFGSLFLLVGILYIWDVVGTTNFFWVLTFNFSFVEQTGLYLCFFLAFAIKIPVFPFHIWLPEAHVEAPTIGSVILASLLLKLGGYGFLRFSLPLFPLACHYFNILVYILAIVSIIYAALTAIRQIDLKRIIAYSSIAHMNLIVLGLFSLTQQGLDGAVYLMLAHGFVSAALFFCIGVLYDRYHTRLLKYYGGLVQVMPLFSTIFFLFTLANMSFPGTANFVGELLILIGVFQKNVFILILAGTSIVLGAVYSIWLFNRVIFGTLKVSYISSFIDLNFSEIAIFIPLIIAMCLLGINSDFVLNIPLEEIKMLLSN